ncbi:YceI family protein [Bdellovibrio sp. NC01]|uniref:YceI family protein n=1 Tax=Bdellovibrio sp. NC01 TaxID=2220073 RepID=UPI001158ED35|nr:YceI family protein [Bdellovibrio sp. NC01]QDK39358.1 YceI family protein [Bdellovibrio sp. NC01]
MKIILVTASLLFSSLSFAQMAVVDVSLRPAGSFKVKTSDVKGFAEKKADHFEAHNIVVNLKGIQTGVSLRDEHTKKHLDVEKYPDAVLVSATGKDGKGEGVLRIRGIDHKIQGSYKLEGSNLVAQFPLKLSDYKIDGIKYMGVGVSDEVNLLVTVPVKQN